MYKCRTKPNKVNMIHHSRLDKIYRSMLITKFFEKGWGKPENLQRYKKIYIYRDKKVIVKGRDFDNLRIKNRIGNVIWCFTIIFSARIMPISSMNRGRLAFFNWFLIVLYDICWSICIRKIDKCTRCASFR